MRGRWYFRQTLVKMTLLMIVLSTLTGCARKIHHAEIYSKVKPDPSERVAVVPFTGYPYLRDIAAEWLTYRLRQKIDNPVISPAMVEKQLDQHHIKIVFHEEERSIDGNDTIASHAEKIPSRYSSANLSNAEYTTSEDSDEVEMITIHLFSEKDLIRIGETIDADFVIGGYVEYIANYGISILIGIQIVDVKKKSVIADFTQSHPRSKEMVPYTAQEIETVLPEIETVFQQREEKE